MKCIYKKIFFVLFTAIAMISCEDEDKDPLFVDTDSSNDAAFVKITKKTDVIDFTNSESSYDFTISAPKNNVKDISIGVRRIVDGDTSDVKPIATANSFPTDFSFTVSDLSEALGVPATDFAAGNQFDFISTANGTNGLAVSFNNLNGDSRGPGQFQGFNHTTYLSCPFNVSEALGSYTVTDQSAPHANTNFEIVAGPDASTVTVVGLFPENFDMQIFTKTGIAVIPKQEVGDKIFFNFDGGSINTSATSFFFSCVGNISLTIQRCVDLGCFTAPYTLSASKD